MNRRHRLRRLHRTLVPMAALPLLITALTGSLYGALSARDIEAFWLMKLHTGHFGAINFQPYYSTLLGVLTLFVAGSWIGLWLTQWGGGRQAPPPST
ncbi:MULTISPECIES: hypothetical protein [unclassified Cyanobium]|uniref:hypothetical protein n=1 Tax=unclassified Cyanobium TaxID=2627006 RepID=UPI0020CF92F0|nr:MULTISPECIES: hypothetical protein [unclassified Cyanobium]MCP9861214.1 hypothetical protein [Cyanobium sp. Cruz-8H5]MCP9868460.1 hypothetical protein [Cyanobium sp. Cruz-8D1]